MTNKKLLFAAALLLAGCAGPEKRINNTLQAASAAEKKKDLAAMAKLSGNIPDAYLLPERLSAYPEETLALLYKTLKKISFYTPDSEANALKVEKVFEEKFRRGTFEADDVERVYGILLAARLFGRAAAVKDRFPAIIKETLPEIIVPDPAPAGNWRVYEVSADGRRARLKTLRVARGVHIIMAMSPGCGVSARAVKEILADQELGPIFEAGAFLVTARFDAAGVLETRRDTGLTQVHIAHKWGDFPGVSFMTSPWIFFLKDGRVVYDMRGWADDGAQSLKRFRRGLEAIGLKPQPGL